MEQYPPEDKPPHDVPHIACRRRPNPVLHDLPAVGWSSNVNYYRGLRFIRWKQFRVFAVCLVPFSGLSGCARIVVSESPASERLDLADESDVESGEHQQRQHEQEQRVADAVHQTWNWVIGSPGQRVIWVIFHVRVTGSSL